MHHLQSSGVAIGFDEVEYFNTPTTVMDQSLTSAARICRMENEQSTGYYHQ